MSTIPVSTIVDVTISAAQPGLNVPNVSNICILNTETPAQPGNLTTNIGIYTTSTQVGVDWGTDSEAYAQAVAIFDQKPNPLAADAVLIIYHMTGGITTLTQAINAVEGLVYAGAYLWAGYSPNNAEIEAAAAVANSIGSGKPLGCSSYQTSDLNSPSGLFYTLSGSDIPAAIMFLYTIGGTAVSARIAIAALFASQMSTNFDGQNTTINANLKTLQGVLVDTGITSTILTTCATLGVYTYPSIQGVVKVVAAGGPNNNFFDNVYNLNWFSNAVQIAVFNALAETNTKIPQTEAGMQVLKDAIQGVCQQGVTNGYIAPGTWTGTDTFGNQASFLRNIQQLGYYIFSNPIASQSQSQRAQRKAPLIQVAIKLAGAIDTATINIFVQP